MMEKIQPGLAAAAYVTAIFLTAPSAYATESQAHTLARLIRADSKEIIGEQDVEEYLSERVELRAIARNALGLERVVREMAFMRTLNLEGEQLSITRTGTNTDSGTTSIPRFDGIYALAVQKKLEPVCKQPANEQEARQYFDKNREAFMVPAQARVQRIVIPHSAQVAGQNALNWLKEQARSIASGTPFADVVEQAEQAQPLELQGDLGWVQLDDENSVLAALRSAREGELVGPLQEGNALYLFQVTRKRPARLLAWEEIRSFAAVQAETHCRENGEKQLRERLFQKYKVEIDQAAIRAALTETTGDPKQ